MWVEKHFKTFQCCFHQLYFVLGTRLLFNIIIYLKASERLPEFSGLMGKVYPGQMKPLHQIPEPRIDLNGFEGNNSSGHMILPKIILIKPI